MTSHRLHGLWDNFWIWAGRVPLRAKIIGIVLTATCLTGSGVLIWTEGRLSLSTPERGAMAAPFELNELLVIVLIAMAVGLIVAWLLTSILTHQITQLTKVAQKVARGDLSQRAPVWADDEIGQLAATFNLMIDSLAASQQSLEATNARLTERTETLGALYSLAALAAETADIDRILADGLEKARQITEMEAGAVLLTNSGGEFTVRAKQDLTGCLHASPDPFTSIKPVLRRVIENAEQAQTAIDCPAQTGHRLFVRVAPLQARNSVKGVLVLLSREKSALDPARSDSFLLAICSQLGIAVENTQLWNELKQRDAMRTRLLANAVSAQEQERERISRELHDETGQALTALLVQLKVFERLRDEKAIAKHAETLRQLVLATLEEVRRLARDLRPGMLDELGLVPTLEWHTRTYAQNTGIPVDFEALLPEDFRLPVHTELALYRVVQEALTNVVRHANATRASVRLTKTGDGVRLAISDDGCGFDVAAVMNAQERGVGLLGIQERVELIGGNLSVESTPGNGTSLIVEVPLNERMVAV
ncbi:MAG: HAMP domain-containing protein [Chloroflexota bacterium]|nr:MAG: hypothetical protein DIU68_13785 [Chloroflexota bacterium]